MKKRSILTTVIAFVLRVAVIAAGLNAIFTVTYVRANFRTYTERGAAAAEELKEELNGYVNRSSVFLDLAEVRATVEANPRFEVVAISKDYPETIAVEIVERREAFVIADDAGTYTLLDEEGVVLDTISGADEHILLEGFGFTVTDGVAGGEYFGDLMDIYASLRESLGEVRANVDRISLESPAQGWAIIRIYMHEGTQIELVDPGDRAGEMTAAAVERYLAMSDADRVFRNISVTITTEGDITVDVGNIG